MECVFCKIIKGEIPSYKVYEDESVYAFLDINPVNFGHTLVIPKKHYENMEEIDKKILCDLIKVVKKIGGAIKKGLKVEGYNINLNNGSVAGQVVPHFHFHIIPRLENDGLKLWDQGEYKNGEAENVLNKIKKEL